ncbi:DNA/RNA non-specific endonuclease [Herbiconiux sp.]|uniref:DNA/RNA non-specific endonuclease n=1 Tax=Herbiconiux sp. TaxID=1871186 RepID=UPI0025B85ED6|nr:DNA/RNA non-specific endonuclease [Herbiconiux sp.]
MTQAPDAGTTAAANAPATGPGFDPGFLGVECPLPAPGAGRSIRTLPYTHFSVLLDAERRLAAATGVNIDGRLLTDLARGDDWHLDPRVPADEQAGPELYARNDLDRGHLVRRRDPVWGTAAVAERANTDTFAYTNAAPQAAEFNQSKKLWNGLEDHVIAYAEANLLKLSVFTGPVFDASDPVYRGIRIPQRFWKVAAWFDTQRDGLAAAGFLLEQTAQLSGIDLESATSAQATAPDAVPPLGPFRTFQLPVTDIAHATDLAMPALVTADVYLPPLAAAGRRRVRLEHYGQVRL